MPADAAEAEATAVARFDSHASIYVRLCSDVPTATVLGTPVDYVGYTDLVPVATADFTGDDAGGRVNDLEVDFGDPTDGDDVAYAAEFFADAGAVTRLWYEELDDPLEITAALDHVVISAGMFSIVFGGAGV